MAMPQMDEKKMQMVQDLEIEMMTDMYSRLTSACHKKCISPKYREAELQKGEAVCIDRCVSKYLEIHERIGNIHFSIDFFRKTIFETGKKLTEISMQDQEFQARMAGAAGVAP